ncbi:winged helix-turn-helix domain-containing protein [Hydrogeniiclostridium mannosilyticum]|uniref:winged helix-turn-helix domain-containing protein n=1 Tax=Hydrogeniiclostridium mannosilyticum TaxID=2764322 RepID=UPI002114DC37|nr:response regulator transcription factor [Hydrogeniiclostridium mannosilyticum]
MVSTVDAGANSAKHNWQQDSPLTEIREGDLYLCLEHRLVKVREQEIGLTAKEFDILFLLVRNPKRVFTYELIMDFVWNEDYTYYSRKAITNHVSNLRKKLKIRPDDPDYIKNVTGIGYKFA